VISQSPTDAQPVFDTIVHNAVLLCSADHGNVFRFDGRLLHWTAAYNVLGEPLEEFKSSFPRPVSEAGGLRDVLGTGGVLRMDDVDEDDAPFSSRHSPCSEPWACAVRSRFPCPTEVAWSVRLR